jgi:hypothetical protein
MKQTDKWEDDIHMLNEMLLLREIFGSDSPSSFPINWSSI